MFELIDQTVSLIVVGPVDTVSYVVPEHQERLITLTFLSFPFQCR